MNKSLHVSAVPIRTDCSGKTWKQLIGGRSISVGDQFPGFQLGLRKAAVKGPMRNCHILAPCIHVCSDWSLSTICICHPYSALDQRHKTGHRFQCMDTVCHDFPLYRPRLDLDMCFVQHWDFQCPVFRQMTHYVLHAGHLSIFAWCPSWPQP